MRQVQRTLIGVMLACACLSPHAESSPSQKAPATARATAAAQSTEPAVAAEYGVVLGRRSFESPPDYFIRDPDYTPGVFAVAITNRERLLAFDVNSNVAGICTRMDQQPFEVPNRGNLQYVRFQCGKQWPGRESVFVDAVQLLPTHGVQLEWSALAGPSPLPRPRAKRGVELHDYAAAARPGLLNGQWLVSAAWFSGEYPPKQEPDELRGDTIAFGHYQLLDRTIFIGESSKKPTTVFYKTSDPIEVREGLEWALLPQNASEKTHATMSALYEIPNGYLLRVSIAHDHEGFGEDDFTYLYAWQSGRWRLLAKAEYTRLY